MQRHTEILVPGEQRPASDNELAIRIEELKQKLQAEQQAHEATQRRLNAATQGLPPNFSTPQAFVPVTEHGAKAMAASQHLHMTADECTRAGLRKVVLCRDGWFVPPELRAN